MGSSYGEGLSLLYLELVNGYKKRFMPQNRQVAILKWSQIWKKMRKSFNTLSKLKLEFLPEAWKREAMAHKTPISGSSLKKEIPTRLLFFFYSNLTICFSCVKTWVDVSWEGAYLCYFFNYKKINK